MSYQRFLKPAYYPSFLPHMVGRGYSISTLIDLQSGTLNTGSSEYDLIDGRPLSRVSFDTSSTTTAILLRFDFGVTSEMPLDFVAILNHNFYTAGATAIQVRHHTSAFTSVSDGTAVTLTAVVGGTTGSGGDPPIYYPVDGSTIYTFPEVDNKRYWAIVITYHGAAFTSTDLEIGQIMLGRRHVASAGPDVGSIRRSVDFDGIQLETSIGGQTFGNASYIAPGGTSSSFGQPFHNATTSYWRRAGGRRSLKFRQHFMLDTEMAKDDISSGVRGDSFEENVLQITAGALHPLVFCPDSTSTTLGDYMFARLQASMVTDEVAHNVRSMDVAVTEEL